MPFPSAISPPSIKKGTSDNSEGWWDLSMKLFRKAKKPKQREFHVNWDTLEIKQGKRR